MVYHSNLQTRHKTSTELKFTVPTVYFSKEQPRASRLYVNHSVFLYIGLIRTPGLFLLVINNAWVRTVHEEKGIRFRGIECNRKTRVSFGVSKGRKLKVFLL